MNIGGFEAFVVVFLVLAAVALWSTVKIVPQGYNYTVENFGRTPARSIRVCTYLCR
jgi:regulator of protease activity HflC (stomatin/prohibitin superfamily)